MGFNPHFRDSFGVQLYEYDDYNVDNMAKFIRDKSPLAGISYELQESKDVALSSLKESNMFICDDYIHSHLIDKIIAFLAASKENVELVSIDFGSPIDFVNIDRRIYFPGPKFLNWLKNDSIEDDLSTIEYANKLKAVMDIVKHPQRYIVFKEGIKSSRLRQMLFLEAIKIKSDYKIEILKEYITRDSSGRYSSQFSILISPYDDMEIFARISRTIFMAYL